MAKENYVAFEAKVFHNHASRVVVIPEASAKIISLEAGDTAMFLVKKKRSAHSKATGQSVAKREGHTDRLLIKPDDRTATKKGD